MKGKTFQFDFRDLRLTVDQIEMVMGYSEEESRETVQEIVSKVLAEADTICNIRAEYRIFDRVIFNDSYRTVEISGITFNVGKIIFGQIRKSESAALFLCTAGDEIGIRSRNAMKNGDLLEGYIYDVIGSEVVETAADLMQNDMEEGLHKSGMRITNRFSPGYCGWDVAEQHKLFRLLPYNFCGIRLTPSALMAPVKSVSGIIGTGAKVKRQAYTCNLCDMKDCIYRRKV
jgi:hypothetical protein